MTQPSMGHIGSLSGHPGQHTLFASFVSKLHEQGVVDVVDLSDDSKESLRVSLILIEVTPSVVDIKHAKKTMANLIAEGVKREACWFYLNGEGAPGGISKQVIEDELGVLKSVWPYDPELALGCENEGRLITEKKPRSALSQAMTQLAFDVSFFIFRNHAFSSTEETRAFSLNQTEKILIPKIWQRMQQLPITASPSTQTVKTCIDQELENYILKIGHIPSDVLPVLRERLQEQVTGYGPLHKWIQDCEISEIMVNAGRIYVEKDGVIAETEDRFDNDQQLRLVIDRMVIRGGRRLDLSSPMVDVRLSDGSRVNVILPPLSLNGPAVTIRKFRPHIKSMSDLISAGSLTLEQSQKLQQAVKERRNIVVAGNTGSGKTTLLNILSGFIPEHERIITLEDTAELTLQQRHVVRLETRPDNTEGAGRVSMSELLVNALRMRPDRLVIGECRGNEVVPMIQAMNTGHDGSLTTVHANSAGDAIGRLESMISIAVPQWPTPFIREQLAAGVDLIVYLKRNGSKRTLTEMAALTWEQGQICLMPI